jgi:hypothetical protein
VVRWEASKAKKDQALCVVLHFLARRVSFSDGGRLFALTCRTRGRGGILSGNAMHYLKFREQSVFGESPRACKGSSVCALERGELSDTLCARRMPPGDDIQFYTIGFFGDDKATVRVLFRRTRTNMVIAFRA